MSFKFGVWVCGGVNFHASGRRKRGWEVFRELVRPSTDSEILVELDIDSLDVGTVGNVREGLGGRIVGTRVVWNPGIVLMASSEI